MMQIKMKDSKQVLESVLTQGISCIIKSGVAVLIELTQHYFVICQLNLGSLYPLHAAEKVYSV